MPSIYEFQLDTSIEGALIAARNSMLPAAFARHELVRWITGTDSPGPDLDAHREGREPRLNELVTFVILEEALTFYLATLYHLGRIVQASDYRIELISRLRKGPNFKASAAGLSTRMNLSASESGSLLRKRCSLEVKFQRERKSHALGCWKLWQQWVGVFRLLLTSYLPLLKTDAGVGASFLLCTNGVRELLAAMPEDKDSFLASSSPFLARVLDGVASSHRGIYKTFADPEYWSGAEAVYRRVAPARQGKHANALRVLQRSEAIGLQKYADLVRVSRGLDTSPFSPRADLRNLYAKRIQNLEVERTTRKMLAQGKWGDEGLGPHARSFLQKMTKLFIIGSRRPPIWQRVLSVAKWSGIASALREAGVSAEYLINSFADELVIFSKQSDAPMPRIPLADDEWCTWTTLFFHSWWIPGLRARGAGRLVELNDRKFEVVAKAAAFLFGAMGYTVADQKPVPPPGGGGLTESGYVPRFETL